MGTTSLSIFGGTWNINGKKPSPNVNLIDWLTSSASAAHDMYFIGMQEVQPLSGMNAVATDASRGKLWKDSISNTLKTSPTTCKFQYKCIVSRQMVGILLLVYIKQDLAQHLTNLKVSEVGTGFLSLGGNKGAVAASWILFDCVKMSAVACHLAAHEKNVDRRNQDFRDVIRRAFNADDNEAASMVINNNGNNNGSSTLNGLGVLDHDIVFWLGDLNYRINLPLDTVMQLVREQKWKQLREYDQLNQVRKSRKVTILDGFEEAAELNFAPTYKHELYSNQYLMDDDGGAKRTPAWTDRILYRIHPHFGAHLKLQTVSYAKHENVFSSDHRPVSSRFVLSISSENGVHAKNSGNNQTVSTVEKTSVVVDRIRDVMEENSVRERVQVTPGEIAAAPLLIGAVVSGGADVTNVGATVAHVSINTKELPFWVQSIGAVSSNSSLVTQWSLQPNESIRLGFDLVVDPLRSALARELCESIAKGTKSRVLESVVRLGLGDQSEIYCVIQTRVVPSALGVPLKTLSELKDCAKSDLHRLMTRGAGVPVEVFVLVESMVRMVDACARDKRRLVYRLVSGFDEGLSRKQRHDQVDYVMHEVIDTRMALRAECVDVLGLDGSSTATERSIHPHAVWMAMMTLLRFSHGGAMLSSELWKCVEIRLDSVLSTNRSLFATLTSSDDWVCDLCERMMTERGGGDDMLDTLSERVCGMMLELYAHHGEQHRVELNTTVYLCTFVGYLLKCTQYPKLIAHAVQLLASAMFPHSLQNTLHHTKASAAVLFTLALTNAKRCTLSLA
mmetsp:Transcript_4335/g.7604  ORF Transcript_4335/g.7604 Transcript_4335/m.7604 type:complete len:788 (-) Transcript_4335:38-2401(-)